MKLRFISGYFFGASLLCGLCLAEDKGSPTGRMDGETATMLRESPAERQQRLLKESGQVDAQGRPIVSGTAVAPDLGVGGDGLKSPSSPLHRTQQASTNRRSSQVETQKRLSANSTEHQEAHLDAIQRRVEENLNAKYEALKPEDKQEAAGFAEKLIGPHTADFSQLSPEAQTLVRNAIAEHYVRELKRISNPEQRAKAETELKALVAEVSKNLSNADDQNFLVGALAFYTGRDMEVPVYHADGTPQTDAKGNPVTKKVTKVGLDTALSKYKNIRKPDTMDAFSGFSNYLMFAADGVHKPGGKAEHAAAYMAEALRLYFPNMNAKELADIQARLRACSVT